MRPTVTQSVHHIGDSEKDIRASIDQSSIAHIMSILTDLYSDPMLAVIREYSTNAIDSNIEAGNPDPIKITLPTSLKPTFVVQDQGVGLSVDDMERVYSMYGTSTKRDSDEVTGMLGLGCKSGLTYALTFNIIAIKGGVRTAALFTKDEDGVGVIKIIDTRSSTERNGVTIQIPVKAQDVESFRMKAESFYSYWRDGTVSIHNRTPVNKEAYGDGPAKFSDNPVWIDDDVAVVKDLAASKIVMGGVAYPFRPKTFPHGIVAYVPMGSVSFTPSREALYFNRPTEATIATIEEFAKERFFASLMDKVKDAPNNFERGKMLAQWNTSALTRGKLKDHPLKLMVRLPGTRQKVNGITVVDEETKRNAWTYHGNYGRGSCSRLESSVPWSYINDTNYHFVVNYPNKAIPAGHKDRVEKYGIPQAVFIPVGSDIEIIDGRPKVVEWETIVDATPAPKSTKTGPRQVKKYTVLTAGQSYETEQIKDDVPIIVVGPRENAYHLRKKFPEAHIVELYARQVERFKKLHPTATGWYAYEQAEKAKALAAITDDDKIAKHLAHSYLDFLKSSKPHILDPELRHMVGLIGPESKTLARANALYVQVPHHPSNDRIAKRYPLLFCGYNRGGDAAKDALLYVNAKWLQLEGANAVQRFSGDGATKKSEAA